MSENSTRAKIIECADQLFYEQGFEHTSLMDIADLISISKGNFYYHFKSKDEILDAVIQLRLSNTQLMLDEWDEGSNPRERIKSFIHILIRNKAKILKFGCPIGTLSTELSKLDHKSKPDANKLFSLFRHWLCHQFKALGYASKADGLAMHLLARSQGVSTLSSAFKDENFIRQEVDQMCEWLNSPLSISVN